MNTRSFLLAAVAVAVGGCAVAIAAGADYSPTVDFDAYTSFTWDEPDERPVGDPRLENNPFFEERLHAAIAVELAEVGIQPNAGGRALIVHHHATVRDRVEVYEADERAGYASPEYGGGTQVVQYDEGTILIDISDAQTHDVVWRGWAQFDIGRALTDPQVMEDAIFDAVQKMFEQFPAQR